MTNTKSKESSGRTDLLSDEVKILIATDPAGARRIVREIIAEIAGGRHTYKHKLLMDSIDSKAIKMKIRERVGLHEAI
jgi:hypothetical protein